MNTELKELIYYVWKYGDDNVHKNISSLFDNNPDLHEYLSKRQIEDVGSNDKDIETFLNLLNDLKNRDFASFNAKDIETIKQYTMMKHGSWMDLELLECLSPSKLFILSTSGTIENIITFNL